MTSFTHFVKFYVTLRSGVNKTSSNSSDVIGSNQSAEFHFTEQMMEVVEDVANVSQDICGRSTLTSFHEEYSKMRGVVELVICTIGVLTNILTVLVLTRKHMRSPINLILTAIAVVDVIFLTSCCVHSVAFSILSHSCYSRTRRILEMIVYHLELICHTVNMWFLVCLTIIRYAFICCPRLSVTRISLRRTKEILFLIVVTAAIGCIPVPFSQTIVESNASENTSEDLLCYEVGEFSKTYTTCVMFIYGIVIKIIPSLLILVFSSLLIIHMKKAKQESAKVCSRSSGTLLLHRNKEHHRITMMLIVVVICAVVSETPNGVLSLISAVDHVFLQCVYMKIGDIFDIIAIINMTLNFMIYCSMSKHFRDTFRSMLHCKLLKETVSTTYPASYPTFRRTMNKSTYV